MNTASPTIDPPARFSSRRPRWCVAENDDETAEVTHVQADNVPAGHQPDRRRRFDEHRCDHTFVSLTLTVTASIGKPRSYPRFLSSRTGHVTPYVFQVTPIAPRLGAEFSTSTRPSRPRRSKDSRPVLRVPVQEIKATKRDHRGVRRKGGFAAISV